jgi:hypothetical protein
VEIFLIEAPGAAALAADFGAFRQIKLARWLPLPALEDRVAQQATGRNSINVDNFCEWIRLIQSEYFEMPGLRLSKPQAQRLWNLDERACDLIFDALEASSFLKRSPDRAYLRADIDY